MIRFFIHIILAFSVFFSSAGVWVNQHYCQNQYVKTSFILSFGSCCSEQLEAPCSDGKTSCEITDQEDKNCCTSESSFYKLDQNQKIEEIELKAAEKFPDFVPPYPAPYNQLSFLDKRTIRLFNYIPPPIYLDFQTRLQTFLC